jgi:hypothetical protein
MPVAVSVGIYIIMPIGIIRSIRIGNPNYYALESIATVILPFGFCKYMKVAKVIEIHWLREF